jgi:AraC-like DNA-binding protein
MMRSVVMTAPEPRHHAIDACAGEPLPTMADGLKSECVQLESGSLAPRWTVVRLPPLTLQFVHETVSVARRLRVPDDRWAFIVPLVVPRSARWNGVSILGGEVIVCSPRSEGYAFDPGGMRLAVISVSPSLAPALVSAALHAARTGESAVLEPGAAAASALCERLMVLESAGEPRRDGEALGPRRAGVMLMDRLAASVCSPAPHAATGGGRRLVVRQAEEFFQTHMGEPVSIAQLSATANVSERSLRNAFYRIYTTSPKRYLRLWQLHQVRNALGSPERTDATVTDIATLYGFYELGRFAGAYKALFGEAPSETLHKSRGRLTARGAA